MKTKEMIYSSGYDHKGLWLQIVVGLAVMLGSLVWLAGGAHAATIQVEAGVDTVASDSVCHLSEAIENLNDGASTHSDCTPIDGSYGVDDVLLLPSGTININAQKTIDVPVSIIGAGKDESVIDAGDNGSLIIYTNHTPPFDLVATGFTISNGLSQDFTEPCLGLGSSTGGSDHVSVTVVDVAITDCAGVSGLVVMVDDEYDSISTSLSNIVVSTPDINKSLLVGVAMFNSISDVKVESSTISDVSYGLMYNMTRPGDLMSFDLINTTITKTETPLMLNAVSGNSPGPDPVVYDFIIINNTIVNNSAIGNNGLTGAPASGLYNEADGSTVNIDLRNNIIANNTQDGSLANCTFAGNNGSTSNVSTGGNLSDDDCDGKLGGSDFPNTPNIDSTLGELQDNGGGVPTMALLTDSPAIDTGTTIVDLAADARGILRPQGAGYDIGAYELAVEGGGPVDDSDATDGDTGDDGGNPSAGSDDTDSDTPLADTGVSMLHVVVTALLMVSLGGYFGVSVVRHSAR